MQKNANDLKCPSAKLCFLKIEKPEIKYHQYLSVQMEFPCLQRNKPLIFVLKKVTPCCQNIG